jgi:paraquat-inducible protein B
MTTQPNARLGAFVLGALVIAIIALAVLGSNRLFRKTHPFILVFRGNVNGLRVGAAVKIKGVTIGAVTSIGLRLDFGLESVANSRGGIQIPVLIEIDERRITRGVGVAGLTIEEDVRRAVQQGLRAQLNLESFVTGVLYIDLDMHPGAPANYAMPPGSTPPEIPTVKRTFEQAQSAATRIISQLDKIQLDQLVATANQTMTAIGDLARSPEIKTSLVSFNRTATSLGDVARSIRDLTEHVDSQVGPTTAGIRKVAHDIDDSVLKAQVALDRLQGGLQPDAPLMYRANQALENVSAAARSLRDLGDYLQRNPSAIVRGRYYGNQ